MLDCAFRGGWRVQVLVLAALTACGDGALSVATTGTDGAGAGAGADAGSSDDVGTRPAADGGGADTGLTDGGSDADDASASLDARHDSNRPDVDQPDSSTPDLATADQDGTADTGSSGGADTGGMPDLPRPPPADASETIVAHAYLGILGREVDSSGLAAYTTFLDGGGSVLAFTQILYDSAEYAENRAGLSYDGLAGDLYEGILFRAPSSGERSAAVADLGAGQGAVHATNLLLGDEFRDRFLSVDPPGGVGPLRAQGSQFVDPAGNPVYLAGAIICCEEAKARGWPLVDDDTLSLFAAHGVNYTHVRIGPNTPLSEGPEFGGYLAVGENVVDLDQWNPAFWNLLRHVVRTAGDLGIFVEISVIDAWVLERPELSPWGSGNNVNGVSAGDCSVLGGAPQPVHERWLRKVVREIGDLPNVLFEIGNETFDCGGSLQPAWSVGVAQILRDELSLRGYGTRLIGTNSHNASIEGNAAIDYVNRHSSVQWPIAGKPTMVNEYGETHTAAGYRALLDEAYARGTSYHLWRMWQTDAAFGESLDQIADFRASLGTAESTCDAPPMPECGAPEGPPGVWGCCVEVAGGGGEFNAIVNASIDTLRAERPDLFAGTTVLDEDAYVQGVAAVVERDYGLCARQGEPRDEIGVKRDNGSNEQYDILFSSMQVRYDGHVVTCNPARF